MQWYWGTLDTDRRRRQRLLARQLEQSRRFRELRVEQLESRCLLSGVTLITHGFNSNADGWVTAMAEAIGNRSDLTMDEAIYRLAVTDPGHDNGPLSVTSTKLSGSSPTDTNTPFPEIALVLDWSDVAGAIFGGYARSTYDVAAAVSDALVTPGFLADLAQPLASLPLQVMGHSRGGSLVGELAKQLGLHGIWVDQVTTLDPHPVDGVDDLFGLDFGDAPMVAWDNVVYWDNYWRANSSAFDFNGEPVDNTYDLLLDDSVLANGGYSFSHSDVHLWYYGTIDTSENPPANNGDEDVPNDWYGGVHPERMESGFAYSRLVGWPREANGLTAQIVGGLANRDTVNLTQAGWPNVPDLQVTAADVTFTGVTTIPLDYYYQDPDSTATITFSLDMDKNPFNTNQLELLESPVVSSATLQSGSASLSTSGVPAGSYFVLATITDAGGRTRYTYAPQSILIQYAAVMDRHIFYNNSKWDAHTGFTSGDPAANAFDDNAIAMDKQPLVTGQKATFANYTSYSRGINGIMIDVAGLADPAGLAAADFAFRVGNNNDPASWPLLALDPSQVTINVREGAGTDGSDRVTILFPDGTVKKTWLQVTVKATAATGLAAPDVHYWGNAIGDCGNSTSDTAVNVADQLGARAHPHTLLTPAPVDDAYDYNRDKQVNVQDELIARSNPSTLLTDVNLIDLTGFVGGEGEGASVGEDGGMWVADPGILFGDQDIVLPEVIGTSRALAGSAISGPVTARFDAHAGALARFTANDFARLQVDDSALMGQRLPSGSPRSSTALAWLPVATNWQLQVGRLDASDQQAALLRRPRWASDNQAADGLLAHQQALQELLAEWDQFWIRCQGFRQCSN